MATYGISWRLRHYCWPLGWGVRWAAIALAVIAFVVATCTGSAMTDPYREDYTEFLFAAEWGAGCAKTLAAQPLVAPTGPPSAVSTPTWPAPRLTLAPMAYHWR